MGPGDTNALRAYDCTKLTANASTEKKILNKGGAKTGVSYGEYVPHGNLPRVPKHMETVEYSIYFKSQPQG
jgi:hypothetical protein